MWFLGPAYDEIERLDVSSPGATWELSTSTISQPKWFFGTVVDDYGRMFLVGGIEYQTYTGIADVEMILAAEVSEVNEIVITDPANGTGVNGTVEVSVEVKNQHSASVVVIDAYVDDELLESQLGGGATAWTFVWDAAELAVNSTHDFFVRAFFSDGSVSEDEASYVVSPAPIDEPVDERLARIEENLTAVLDAISGLEGDIQSLGDMLSSLADDISDIELGLESIQDDLASLAGDILSIQTELGEIQTQLDSLGTTVSDLGLSTEADLAQLSADLDALASSLAILTTSVAELQATLDEMELEPELNLDEVMDELETLLDAVEGLNRTLDEVTASVGETEESARDASLYALTAIALAVTVLAALVVGILVLRRKPEG